jgi:hypothetical protein
MYKYHNNNFVSWVYKLEDESAQFFEIALAQKMDSPNSDDGNDGNNDCFYFQHMCFIS